MPPPPLPHTHLALTDPPGRALHEYAASGDAEALQAELSRRPSEPNFEHPAVFLKNGGGEKTVAGEGANRFWEGALPPPPPKTHGVDRRDRHGCQPAHIAALYARPACLSLLLDAGATLTGSLEKAFLAHCAAQGLGAALAEGRGDDVAECLKLVLARAPLQAGALDDYKRTPLHLVCSTALPAEPSKGLPGRAAVTRCVEILSAAMLDGGSVAALANARTRSGETALHVACLARNDAAVRALLACDPLTAAAAAAASSPCSGAGSLGEAGEESAEKRQLALWEQRNLRKETAMHAAAQSGCQECCGAILEAVGEGPVRNLAAASSSRGVVPADVAAAHGHAGVLKRLNLLSPPRVDGVDRAARLAPSGACAPALIVRHPACEEHHTCPPAMLTRGGRVALNRYLQKRAAHFAGLGENGEGESDDDDFDSDDEYSEEDEAPPPENRRRLEVLTGPGGSLKSAEFTCDAGRYTWEHEPPACEMSDALRVHDWAYLKRVRDTCAQLPADNPNVLATLDGDTTVSAGTWEGSLRAAGAAICATDAVLDGRARHAFCATRPPGHHAGPSGAVEFPDPTHVGLTKPGSGSHGFCLISNVAVAAAYALACRRREVGRVAIVDFDVHHGNGTEACVRAVNPGKISSAVVSPFGRGVQCFPVWKPWRGENDGERILFASVQGFGEVVPGTGQAFYPGTGCTCDNRPPPTDSEVELAGEADSFRGDSRAAAREWAGVAWEDGPEKPGDLAGAAFHRSSGGGGKNRHPRIIDVGIEGPGAQRALWRRSWRDKILPAIHAHNPDIIFISAGFDAHRRDDMNSGFLGILEADYTWLTSELCKLANTCCPGRVVSVLEGGYRTQGGSVSAFARSVAAHMRALGETSAHRYDPEESHQDREAERRKEEAVRAAREKEQAQLRALQAHQALVSTEAEAAPASAPPVAAIHGGGLAGRGEEPQPKRSRRDRGAVDYAALNQKLEEEERQTREQQGS